MVAYARPQVAVAQDLNTPNRNNDLYLHYGNPTITVNGQLLQQNVNYFTISNLGTDFNLDVKSTSTITTGTPYISAGTISSSAITYSQPLYATGTGVSYVWDNTNPLFIQTSTHDNVTWSYFAEDKKSAFKNKLKSNLLILTNRKRKTLTDKITVSELKARNTLRDLISEADWRRYITNGFIMHSGESGKWYQIFNDQKRTNVYSKGKLIETLCLHTGGKCPPTDHILNIMTLIDYDEVNLGKVGNLRTIDNWTPVSDAFVVHGQLAIG